MFIKVVARRRPTARSPPGLRSPTHRNFLTAGFDDAWSEKDGTAAGFTCCQTADLDDPAALTERIDVVLVRGDVWVVAATRVGEEVRDRTASGLWPSDHAGVSATIRLAA